MGPKPNTPSSNDLFRQRLDELVTPGTLWRNLHDTSTGQRSMGSGLVFFRRIEAVPPLLPAW
jgi:hypothetical protein